MLYICGLTQEQQPPVFDKNEISSVWVKKIPPCINDNNQNDRNAPIRKLLELLGYKRLLGHVMEGQNVYRMGKAQLSVKYSSSKSKYLSVLVVLKFKDYCDAKVW